MWINGELMGVVETFNSQLTPEEKYKRCWARAVEWAEWPAFLSQPFVPILYWYFGWKSTLLSLLVANLVWNTVFCTAVVSLPLAVHGMMFVRLKWPIMAIVSVMFVSRHMWGMACLTILTPLVMGVLGEIRFRRPINEIQEFFMLQLGHLKTKPSDRAARYLSKSNLVD
jgi:hypothetical protein